MMIAVIADDLTGAAEIGGIGLNYGLKVEISRNVNAATTAGMLVINTDARSLNEADAIEVTRKVSQQLKALNPDFIFKKIDSVMRGHVIAEINAQCEAMGLNRTIIVPANPALGRTLVKGHYYINNVPVHQTSFGHDPEFPVAHSHVLTRFKNVAGNIAVQPHHIALNGKSIVIGEAETHGDLSNWADMLQPGTLAAGAAGFFTACMDKLFAACQSNNNVGDFKLTEPILYISGSTFKPSADLVEKLHADNGPVSYMPEQLMQPGNENNTLLNYWANETAGFISQKNKAVMSIPVKGENHNGNNAVHRRTQMALAVKKVFEQVEVRELVIEGGSSAAAILEALNIETLEPVQELAPGVIRSAATKPYANLHVTLKPGSYRWSDKVWAF